MKKIIFTAALAAFALVSCNKEENLSTADFDLASISFNTNSLVGTKALTQTVPTGYQLRFVIQIYNSAGGVFGAQRIVLDNEAGVDQNAATGELTINDLRVPKGTDFKVCVWTDLTATGSKSDRLYSTSDLSQVAIVSPATYNVPDVANTFAATYGNATTHTASLDLRDAFYGKVDISNAEFIKTSGWTTGQAVTAHKTISMTLKRPFARINVVSVDADVFDGIASQLPVSSKIAFAATGNAYATSFNAITGAIISNTAHTTSASLPAWTTTTGAKNTVGVIYLFASKITSVNYGAPEFKLADFNISLYDGSSTLFSTQALTNIPCGQNYVTNIYGYFLTDKATLQIVVSDGFENIWDVTVNGQDDSNNQNGIVD